MRCVASVCAYLIALQASATDLPTLLEGRGIWMKHSSDLNSRLIDRMRKAGIKRVHLMGSSSPKQRTCSEAELPRLVGNSDSIASTVTALKSAGFVTILTLYLPPTKAAVDSLMVGVISKSVAAGVDGVEFDLEGGWSEHPACGYTSHISAFADLRVRAKGLRSNLPVGITTHSGRVNDPNVPKADGDWLSLQLYSTCKPTECDPYTHPTTGPGGKQRQAVPLLVGYQRPVIIGLAAYSQKWSGHTVDEAMRLALNATLSLIKAEPSRFVGYSYWANDSGLNLDPKLDEPFKFMLTTASDGTIKN